MAIAFDGDINQENMKFEKKNYMKRDSSSWVFSGGAYYDDELDHEGIVMPVDSDAIIEQEFADNTIVSYVKLKIRMRDPGQQADTNGRHHVFGICKLYLEAINEDDEFTEGEDIPDGSNVIKTFTYYPKFVHDEGYVDNFTIVQVGENFKLKKVRLRIFNGDTELQTIKIKKTGFWICYAKSNETNIRLLETPADLDTVQEGELCRCAWIGAV